MKINHSFTAKDNKKQHWTYFTYQNKFKLVFFKGKIFLKSEIALIHLIYFSLLNSNQYKLIDMPL